MGVYFRRSRADHSILYGQIWSKFELLQDIMHVLHIYKFKMDQINSNREKVATSIFKRTRAANSVVHGRIWPNFKLIQALLYVTFSHYKSMGIFSDAQGQLTAVGGRIWPNFELLRALMHVIISCKYEKDRLTAEKKWQHRF